MKRDLVDAQAALDWVRSRIPDFEERVIEWLNHNIETGFRETQAPDTHDLIIAREKNPLPLGINVEVGAYINTLRTSLDMVASAIAKREMALNPENVCWPVAASLEDFEAGRYFGSQFVRQLARTSRDRIESFRPYNGGNKRLWALHQLDIIRKHRRLVVVLAQPAQWDVRGFGLQSDYVSVTKPPERVNGELVLGRIRKGRERPQVRFIGHLAFAEGTLLQGAPIIGTIYDFAELARGVIQAFDC